MPGMTTLGDVIQEGRLIKAHRPWPRVIVGREVWEGATHLLEDGQFSLLGLWGAKAFVHMAIVGPGADGPAVLSLACDHNRFPSVGRSASACDSP